MRVRVSETDFEVRVQERRVVVADIFFRGNLIASGQATQAPQDEWDLREGQKIALARMVNKLRDVQREEMEYVKRTHPLGRALTFTLTNGTDLYNATLAKLDRKREKKAKEDRDRQAVLNRIILTKSRQLGTGYFHQLREASRNDFLRRYFRQSPPSR